MRIKVQIDLNSPTKSWYSLSDRFNKFSTLLESLSADFGFTKNDISMTMDGFELPLFLNPFSILKEDDLILISWKSGLKRKTIETITSAKKFKPNKTIQSKFETKSSEVCTIVSKSENDRKEAESNSESDGSNSSDSSTESDGESSSSDSESSSSDTEASNSGSDETEETTATKQVRQSVDPSLVKTLHKNKRKAVNNMLHIKPLHQKFGNNEPQVFNTKVELFNLPGTFSDNQMKRHRKTNKQNAQLEELEEEQENFDAQYLQEVPMEESDIQDFEQNEGESGLDETYEPNTQAVEAVDYNELPVLKEPIVDAEIVYKTLELSLAYTAEISDFKRARIVSFSPTKKSFKVVLQKLQPDVQKMPSSAWEPKIHEYIFPKGRKFEIEEEQEVLAEDIVEVDWKDLIEVRLIE
ncbi:hypothetical protein HDV06_004079 [Boothiomyces sp. JEL0866]|nr:hypothetical protein HDV06_004079 [Boothiomyces sp. JEL0866]